MRTLDHLIYAAETLVEGCDYIEALTGVRPGPGGQHLAMGTHNALLSLGLETYLEVIAIDPSLPKPNRPRWFDLDNFSGPPRLIHWACRVPDLAAVHPELPSEVGEIVSMSRGDLHWKITIPEDGSLPFGGAYPTHLEWPDGIGAAARLPDQGVRLEELKAKATALPEIDDPRLLMGSGKFALEATFKNP